MPVVNLIYAQKNGTGGVFFIEEVVNQLIFFLIKHWVCTWETHS